MPIYCFNCTDENCNFDWEDYLDVCDELPKICPKCNQETAARCLPTSFSVRVELYGAELNAKLRDDGHKMKLKAATNENTLENLVGREKYKANVKDFGG